MPPASGKPADLSFMLSTRHNVEEGPNGPFCQEDACEGDPCGAGGVCVDLAKQKPAGPEGSFSCICNAGYDLVGTSAANDVHCERVVCGALITTAHLLLNTNH